MPGMRDDIKPLWEAVQTFNMNRKDSVRLLLILALTGFFIVLYSTKWGGGLSSDSFQYVAMSRNFAAGRGLYEPGEAGQAVPASDLPSLYPVLLGLLGNLNVLLGKPGVDPLVVARWLNAFLFGGTILLAGVAIRKLSGGSFRAPLFGAFLVLSSPDMFRVHRWVLPEGLFLFFGLGGLVLLILYLENKVWSRLFAASAAIGLAWLSGSGGISLSAAGAVSILFLVRWAFLKKPRESFAAEDAASGNSSSGPAAGISAVFATVFLSLLFVSFLFSVADRERLWRISCPVILAFLIALPCLAEGVYSRLAERRYTSVALVFFCLALAGSNFLRTSVGAYTGRKTGKSATVEKVKRYPEGVAVYANSARELAFLAGRPVLSLPSKRKGDDGGGNADYSTRWDEIGKRVREGPVAVIFFAGTDREDYPSDEELLERFGLKLHRKKSYSAIYFGAKHPF